jgi:hypothetical protein
VFLVSISVLTMLTTISSMLLLLQAYEDEDVGDDDVSTLGRLWKAILAIKIIFLFGMFTLLCAWSLTSLLFFHAMIVSAAQTTNERVRSVYRVGSVDNVADKGCCRNWCTAFCEPWAVSRLPNDLSDIVHCQYTEDETVWDGDAPNAPTEQAAVSRSTTSSTKAGGGEALGASAITADTQVV